MILLLFVLVWQKQMVRGEMRTDLKLVFDIVAYC